jgi:hypothetical protein
MTSRLIRTEAWAVQIISKVQSGDRVEDARVELKREWPDSEKAARRIAGHANSCFGVDILWIIGLDEKEGILGAQPEELSDWWQRVRSQFDGVAPALIDLVVPVQGKSLICLLFETNRPPYVVRNVKYGTPSGGSVEWEIPWREGTSVRSAGRNDLIRLLVPTLKQPDIEVLGGYGSLREKTDYPSKEVVGVNLAFSLEIYMTPRSDAPAVIPFHRCVCVVHDRISQSFIDGFELTIRRPYFYSTHGSTADSVTMERTSSELLAHGPGKCTIEIEKAMEAPPAWLSLTDLQLRVLLLIIDCDLPVEVDVEMSSRTPSRDQLASWSLRKS